ncbi:MAG: 2OG-Fe(II) oxygenase family protein [Actinomycetota bacterium]
MVPIVDLRDAGGTRALVEALSTVGFVELTGHGLDADRLAAHRRVCDAFFELAPGVKARYEHPEPLANRGYRARGSEALAYSLGEDSPADIFESFNAGRDPGTHPSALLRSTPWPDDEVPGFRAAALDLIDAFTALAHELDGRLGEQLGLPDLASRCTAGPDMLASIDYRPGRDGSEPLLEGQMRMGAHTDYTSFTLLATDPVRGLQIVGPDGGWIDVVPRPGNLLMNVGDLLAIWTNDEWPSTLHRVIPMALGGEPSRRTTAFFHYPDLDVVVEPLERFVGAGSPRYEPISVEDHELGKMGAPKTGEKPTSPLTTGDRDH